MSLIFQKCLFFGMSNLRQLLSMRLYHYKFFKNQFSKMCFEKHNFSSWCKYDTMTIDLNCEFQEQFLMDMYSQNYNYK